MDLLIVFHTVKNTIEQKREDFDLLFLFQNAIFPLTKVVS